MAAEDSVPNDAEPSSDLAGAMGGAAPSCSTPRATDQITSSVPIDGQPVPDGHLLLRRFDPNNEDESTYDEVLKVYSLKPSAFDWNSRDEGRIGTSVYDDAVLMEHALSRQLIPQPRWTDLAGATAETVRAVGSPDSVFSPEHEPYPNGSTRPVDVAHCEVWRPEPTANRRALLIALGQQFKSVPVTRPS